MHSGDDESRGPHWEVRYLDPRQTTLFRTGGDAVRATVRNPEDIELTWTQVRIARAFPLRYPDTYIGLRDSNDRDIGMFRSLEGMDPDSRRILDEELARRYLLPRVVSVRKVRREMETITWELETDLGPRTFHVQNLRDSVQELGSGRVLITDRLGNRVEFPDIRLAGRETRDALARVLTSS